ncbi:hypothetical protein HYW54_04165 [Candidatus Gottesmanbacteria bacterium]|nr:hypothetical protein [Candidatus Gottesmanbacteria bacterium]
MVQDVWEIIILFLASITSFIPQLLAGIIILILGLTIASLLKKAVLIFFSIIKIDKWLEESRLWKGENVKVWPEIIAQLVRWSVVILFLIPTMEVWGMPKASEVLNQLIVYLPNVFIAVLIAFVGMIVANLVFDIVRHTVRGVGGTSSIALGSFARYAILFFTALIVLNQLGVAAELIRILFTGIVAMIALAGGLAFGLGGKEMAAEILRELHDKLKK